MELAEMDLKLFIKQEKKKKRPLEDPSLLTSFSPSSPWGRA